MQIFLFFAHGPLGPKPKEISACESKFSTRQKKSRKVPVKNVGVKKQCGRETQKDAREKIAKMAKTCFTGTFYFQGEEKNKTPR